METTPMEQKLQEEIKKKDEALAVGAELIAKLVQEIEMIEDMLNIVQTNNHSINIKKPQRS